MKPWGLPATMLVTNLLVGGLALLYPRPDRRPDGGGARDELALPGPTFEEVPR